MGKVKVVITSGFGEPFFSTGPQDTYSRKGLFTDAKGENFDGFETNKEARLDQDIIDYIEEAERRGGNTYGLQVVSVNDIFDWDVKEKDGNEKIEINSKKEVLRQYIEKEEDEALSDYLEAVKRGDYSYGLDEDEDEEIDSKYEREYDEDEEKDDDTYENEYEDLNGEYEEEGK